jgi:hypothetical protein
MTILMQIWICSPLEGKVGGGVGGHRVRFKMIEFNYSSSLPRVCRSFTSFSSQDSPVEEELRGKEDALEGES